MSLAAVDYDREPKREKRLNTPPNLPPIGKFGKAEIVHDILPDPMQKGDDQVTARNAAHDILEREHKNGRLCSPDDPDGDAAYVAGLLVQKVLERLAGHVSGGGQWSEGDRVDVSLSADRRMIRLITNAREGDEFIDEIRPVIGQRGLDVMKRAFLHREGFNAISRSLLGRANSKQVFYISEVFRDSCRTLATHFAAVGKGKRDNSVEVVRGSPAAGVEPRVLGARLRRA